MKRISIVASLCICFISIFSINVHAATWKFMWEKTTVVVPVGASIEDYKNEPKAKLFRDGIMLSDTEITYNTEGDWLYYFKDINTSVVGEYKVWYKAYEAHYSPGTCTGYKSLITFRVVDTIPPEISIVSESILVHRGDEYDLSGNYYVKDNHKVETVNVIESINTLLIGTYEVKIVATDDSGNMSTKVFSVIVYEDTKPTISTTALGDKIKIPLNGDISIADYFTASDIVEGDITSKISYPAIKKNEIGSYPYTVTVTNTAGLTAEYTVTIEVVDEEPPVLELSLHSLILDYNENLSLMNFKKYIRSITDNTEVNYDNLTIEHNLENRVGSYSITYIYTDGVFTVTDSISVSMVCYDKPTIEIEDIEIYVDSNVDLASFITVYDASDPNASATLEIYDQNVDYTKEGTYYAEAFCINSSGNSTTKKFKVVVKSNSVFSKVNTPITVIAIVAGAVSIGLISFIVFYFAFKKKIH